MTHEERLNYIQAIYKRALDNGTCHTAKQFAELLDVDVFGFYKAMNGNKQHLTESLIRKVQIFAMENGLEQKVVPEKEETDTDATIRNLSETIKNMSKTIMQQQELIAKLQGHSPVQKKIG